MIRFDVAYYDDTHKKDLATLPCRDRLQAVVDKGLEVVGNEFCAYSMFREQKDLPGWRTFDEMRKLLPRRIQAFRDYFSFAHETVTSRFSTRGQLDNTQIEAAGVGAALTLASNIYGLTEADWQRIPEEEVKTLDHRIASAGDHFVEVEAKGTVTDEFVRKTVVSAKKTDIAEKKAAQRLEGNDHTMIGVITAFPTQPGQLALCRIMDPPSQVKDDDPRRHKILARLYFYWRELSFLTRSHLVIALRNRWQDLAAIRDIAALDGFPLLGGNGKRLGIPSSLEMSKSLAGPHIAFGEAIPMEGPELYFYGFAFDVLQQLLDQQHDSIAEFKSGAPTQLTQKTRVTIRLRKADARRYDVDWQKTSDPNRLQTTVTAKLYANSAGRVVGRLSLPGEATSDPP